MNKKVQFEHLGLIDYQKAWDYQESVFKQSVDLKIDNRKREVAGKDVVETSNYLIFLNIHMYIL